MTTAQILFVVFAGVLLTAALRVITARNPVHAVLFLVLAFFSAACLWMTLRAEFLAIVLVLVYVGAVMVLFLFVVMMLDINIDRMRQGFWRHLPLALVVAAVIVLQLWLVLSHGGWQTMTQPGAAVAKEPSNIAALGRLTFSEYVYPLQVAGSILLVAMASERGVRPDGRADGAPTATSVSAAAAGTAPGFAPAAAPGSAATPASAAGKG
jgi:NADH-quinone oxidoreductase subunit J